VRLAAIEQDDAETRESNLSETPEGKRLLPVTVE
jgi:hypothetical protein